MEVRAINSIPDHFADSNGAIYYKGLKCGQFVNNTGYAHVRLIENGVQTQKQAHRLICAAFHGLPPDGKLEGSSYQCHHINGVKTDNRPSNLQWISKEAHQYATALLQDLKQRYQLTDIRNGFTYPAALNLGQVHNILNTNQMEYNGQKLEGVLIGGREIKIEAVTKAQIKTAGLTGMPLLGMFRLQLVAGVPHKQPQPAPMFEGL